MLLSEVTTPLERHCVIEYAATGNDTVQHRRELKQVTGPLYMSEPKPDQWGYSLTWPIHSRRRRLSCWNSRKGIRRSS